MARGEHSIMTGSYCGRVIDGIPQYGTEDLAALAAAGHEIGCHTFTHLRVSTLSAVALNREIDLNAAFVARHLTRHRACAHLPIRSVTFRSPPLCDCNRDLQGAAALSLASTLDQSILEGFDPSACTTASSVPRMSRTSSNKP